MVSNPSFSSSACFRFCFSSNHFFLAFAFLSPVSPLCRCQTESGKAKHSVHGGIEMLVLPLHAPVVKDRLVPVKYVCVLALDSLSMMHSNSTSKAVTQVSNRTVETGWSHLQRYELGSVQYLLSSLFCYDCILIGFSGLSQPLLELVHLPLS